MTEQPSPTPESEHPDAEEEAGAPSDGNVGPPEDLENDPAYDPDDPELKRMKGG